MNLPQNKPMLLAECYDIMGRTYADLGNYPEAFNNLAKSEHFAGNDPEWRGEAHSERSYVYVKLKNYDQALKEIKEALILNKIKGSDGNIAILYGRLASIFRYKKDFTKALAYLDTAYRMSLEIRNNRLRATTLNQYAFCYNQLHNYDKAIDYAKQGAALAERIGVVDALSTSYRAIITGYEQQNNMKQAMAYQKTYNHLLDSLNKFDKVKNTEIIQGYFELNSQLAEIELIEQNNLDIQAHIKLQRTIIIILAISLLVVIAVLSVTYYFYKQKKLFGSKLHKQNEALINQKQLIEAQTANLENISKVKDKLLAVIGHDSSHLEQPAQYCRNV